MAEEYAGVIAEARDLIEDKMLPDLREVIEPGTDVKALALVTKDGVNNVDDSLFDEYRGKPKRRKGYAHFTKIESLIDHVNRFKDDDTALFANDARATPSIAAVLDYHRAGAEADPRFGEHRSVFKFPLSDEWQAWTGANAKPLPMKQFARFLEDRIIDVIDMIPGEDTLGETLQKYVDLCGGKVASAAKLIELSRGLKVYQNVVVDESANISSGETQVQFSNEHVDSKGRPLNVPNVFLIAIPVFKHGPLYRIAARLRYDVGEGIKFAFELWRIDAAFDDAFGEAVERVRVETELPLFYGSSE